MRAYRETIAETMDQCEDACSDDGLCVAFYFIESSKKCIKWVKPDVAGSGASGKGNLKCYIKKDKADNESSPKLGET